MFCGLYTFVSNPRLGSILDLYLSAGHLLSISFVILHQGLFISIIYSAGCPYDAKNLQNFLICIEMLVAAVLMLFAFPYSEYKISGGWCRDWMLFNAKDCQSVLGLLNQMDLLSFSVA